MNALASRTFAALKVRNYRIYMISQLVSFSGTWMQSLAQSWLVLELTGSGTALGTVLLFQFLPTLLLAPVGGVIADRFDKRRLMMVTQAMAAAMATLLGVLTVSGSIELWMVYAISLGFGINMALDNPTRQTFVMEMVGKEHITNAVTLSSIAINSARALGPAVAGVLIATLGIGECFLVNAASYLVVLGGLLMIDRTQLHTTPPVPRAKGQLRQGFHYAWSTPALRSTLLMLALIGLFVFEFNVTLPLIADHTFDVGSSGLAAFEALFGIGAVVAGLLVAAGGPPSTRRLLRLHLGLGVSMLVLALAPHVIVAYLVMPFIGGTGIAGMAIGNSTLQLTSAPHLRGRVMALYSVAVMGTSPIGGPLVGWIGDQFDPRAAVAIGGVAALGAAAFGWYQIERAQPFEREAADAADAAEAAEAADIVGTPVAGQ